MFEIKLLMVVCVSIACFIGGWKCRLLHDALLTKYDESIKTQELRRKYDRIVKQNLKYIKRIQHLQNNA